ncbi:hypothetical protein HELRODRAFT_163396 [Helobdella robusta]|uniref:Beta-lactamase-related domain-containing protein n=1 Tax=Helobdella robusta TaxID=6412 RepID=T1EU00_HELRO|nr:hypothetical protein HELRODRAFT_163396 [Helobdella robusta]ESN96345.1 hypothetical protein HELRODRAFT_163396 [Helobdella robusta]
MFKVKNSDQRIRNITVEHLLQHSSGWDQKVTGDPVLRPEILKKFVEKEFKIKNKYLSSNVYGNNHFMMHLNMKNRFKKDYSSTSPRLLAEKQGDLMEDNGYPMVSPLFSDDYSIIDNNFNIDSPIRPDKLQTENSFSVYKKDKHFSDNHSRSHARNKYRYKLSKSDVVRYFLSHPLHYDPGTKYSYSNFGYLLLGLIIEKLTSRSYESYMKDILSRMGVQRMKIGKHQNHHIDVSEVEYFVSEPGKNRTTLFRNPISIHGSLDMSILDSSSGWTSSASELVAILEAFYNSLNPHDKDLSKKFILSRETTRRMIERPSYLGKSGQVASSSSSWYGLGIVVANNEKVLWHSGFLEGSSAMMYKDENDITWSILLNCKLQPNDLNDFMKYAVKKLINRSEDDDTNNFSLANFMDSPAVSFDPEHMENDLDDMEMQENYKIHVDQSLESLFDSVSQDRKNFVKTMIPDHKFYDFINLFSHKIYRLIWLDAYNDASGQMFFNTIWSKNENPQSKWKVYLDLIPSRYRRRYKARIAQGYRLAHVESYVSKRKLRYAALFVKDDWPDWTSYEGFSPSKHKVEFYRLSAKGYRLVVQSVSEYKGQLYVAALYDKIYIGNGRVRLGLTLKEFSNELKMQMSKGQVLSYVQAYKNRERLKFSAIWSPKTSKLWAEWDGSKILGSVDPDPNPDLDDGSGRIRIRIRIHVVCVDFGPVKRRILNLGSADPNLFRIPGFGSESGFGTVAFLLVCITEY